MKIERNIMSKKTGNKLVVHYPLLTNPNRDKGDKRTLCGQEVRQDNWINGTWTVHMFSIFPNEINCKECKRLVKGSGMVRYSNSMEDPF